MNTERNSRPEKPKKPDDLNCPGLLYRPRRDGWELRWSPRSDLVARGYDKISSRLWAGATEPTTEEWQVISETCKRLQYEMLAWGRGGVKTDPRSMYDGTFGSLIKVYQTDPDSPYKNLRSSVATYTSHLRALDVAIGRIRVAGRTFRDFKQWHKEFSLPAPDDDQEHLPKAHRMMVMLRSMLRFCKLALPGAQEIADAVEILSDMEFRGGRCRRDEFMTYEHCKAICAEAMKIAPDRVPFGSMALGQAMMFDCGLRQKDVIGEWVRREEPGITDVVRGEWKWIIGARWEEVDDRLIWTHRLSKSVRGKDNIMRQDAGKTEAFDLRDYPLVMAHLRALARTDIIQRSQLPASGPMIVCELTGLPWTQVNWRRHWRMVARAAGVPDEIQNRDSRAGAATEADVAGADRERVRRTLGHSNQETTAGYQRDGMTIRGEIQKIRMEKRS